MSSSRAKDPYDCKDSPILLKVQEYAITVRSFSNLMDFEFSFLPDSFMPISHC